MLQAIESAGKGTQRRLVHIPIIHTEADLGTVAGTLRAVKTSLTGRRALLRHTRIVEQMWDRVEQVVEELRIGPQEVRIYQDGLPICGQELNIVRELAEGGSRNHRVLLRLVDRGATLMGTESPELLIEEYQFATAALVPGGIRAGQHSQRASSALGAALLERRDKFIAGRINETLAAGEEGVLFLGMLHAIEPLLDGDITVTWPLGRPQSWRGQEGAKWAERS